MIQFRRKVPTLTDELNVLTGKPARGFFTQDYEIRQILKDMGREDINSSVFIVSSAGISGVMGFASAMTGFSGMHFSEIYSADSAPT